MMDDRVCAGKQWAVNIEKLGISFPKVLLPHVYFSGFVFFFLICLVLNFL